MVFFSCIGDVMDNYFVTYYIFFFFPFIFTFLLTRRFFDSVYIVFCLLSNFIILITIYICSDEKEANLFYYFIVESGSFVALSLYIYWSIVERKFKTRFSISQCVAIFSFMFYFSLKLLILASPGDIDL